MIRLGDPRGNQHEWNDTDFARHITRGFGISVCRVALIPANDARVVPHLFWDCHVDTDNMHDLVTRTMTLNRNNDSESFVSTSIGPSHAMRKDDSAYTTSTPNAFFEDTPQPAPTPAPTENPNPTPP